MIFDSHAHYDDKQFDIDRDELLSSMKEHGISKIINVGASLTSCGTSLELARQYEMIYAALGVHPSDIADLTPEKLEWLRQEAQDPKVVAIGEIGLDYYWDKEPEVQSRQRQWFLRQLELARQLELPVIIHSRDAAEDTRKILKEAAADLSCVIHCFSYSKEVALEYVDMGYYIGVGGVVTFKNAKKMRQVVEAVPMERILLETDCPYLAPEPHRGTRNSSQYLPGVLEEIARIKGITPKEAEKITYQNAMEFYHL